MVRSLKDQDQRLYSNLSVSSKHNFGQNSEKVLIVNNILAHGQHRESQMEKNMFINPEMKETLTIEQDKWNSRKVNAGEIKELKEKLKFQKQFLNMIIHDLRNPSESIKEGL